MIWRYIDHQEFLETLGNEYKFKDLYWNMNVLADLQYSGGHYKYFDTGLWSKSEILVLDQRELMMN